MRIYRGKYDERSGKSGRSGVEWSGVADKPKVVVEK
jgi:hypothetical protein